MVMNTLPLGPHRRPESTTTAIHSHFLRNQALSDQSIQLEASERTKIRESNAHLQNDESIIRMPEQRRS